MKIFLFVFLLALSGCMNSPGKKEISYEGFSNKKISLVSKRLDASTDDTLGLLDIKIPNRLDTFYEWIDESCTFGGAFKYYRFADKKYSVYRDFSGIGWIDKKFPDSLYQLSVKFRLLPEIPDSVMKKHKIDTSEIGYHLPDPRYFTGWLIKKKESINGRDFILLAYNDMSYLNHQSSEIKVKAITYYRNRLIEVYGECAAKDTANFINSIYKSLLSIKILE